MIDQRAKRGFRISKAVLDQLEGVSKILLIMGTLGGGIWAVFQFRDAQKGARITRTLAYVERFNKDHLLDSRVRLGRTWYNLRDYVARVSEGGRDDADYNQRLSQLVFQVVEHAPVELPDGKKAEGLVGDLDQLQGFFGELQICIEGTLCDKETADSYFADYAQRFYCLHKPFIDYKQRDYDSSYGVKLAALLKAAGKTCDSAEPTRVPAKG
jgi:hypothetical protein